MRVAVLWTRLSGYVNACLMELASRPGVELFVVHETAVDDAPFDDKQFEWMQARLGHTGRPDPVGLLEQVRRFAPDALLVSSWHIREFRYVLKHLRPRPVRILCMDNQWHGTWKQRLGVVGSRWYVRRLYDVVFLPGERQACFAQRLGFRDEQIWPGLYCPDTGAFARVRSAGSSAVPRSFGYLGRLSPEKGVGDLLAAYRMYRAASPAPWNLIVAGTGTLAPKVDGQPGVLHSGFVQPQALAEWLAQVGCLVVPSRFEPWGVVIAEAAAAGLPIIATDACGAVPHLVHDFANGRIARTADIRSLAECMEFIASATDAERAAMGQVSRGLASPYTPARWADTVLGRSATWIEDRPVR